MKALEIFVVLNVAFLAATAVWFRLDHASSASRFTEPSRKALVAEVMWQYSLRSNLLVWGCLLSSYLIYLGESEFLLYCLAGFSLVNVLTDAVYSYEEVGPMFAKVRGGHRVTAIVICSIAASYHWWMK